MNYENTKSKIRKLYEETANQEQQLKKLQISELNAKQNTTLNKIKLLQKSSKIVTPITGEVIPVPIPTFPVTYVRKRPILIDEEIPEGFQQDVLHYTWNNSYGYGHIQIQTPSRLIEYLGFGGVVVLDLLDANYFDYATSYQWRVRNVSAFSLRFGEWSEWQSFQTYPYYSPIDGIFYYQFPSGSYATIYRPDRCDLNSKFIFRKEGSYITVNGKKMPPAVGDSPNKPGENQDTSFIPQDEWELIRVQGFLLALPLPTIYKAQYDIISDGWFLVTASRIDGFTRMVMQLDRIFIDEFLIAAWQRQTQIPYNYVTVTVEGSASGVTISSPAGCQRVFPPNSVYINTGNTLEFAGSITKSYRVQSG